MVPLDVSYFALPLQIKAYVPNPYCVPVDKVSPTLGSTAYFAVEQTTKMVDMSFVAMG